MVFIQPQYNYLQDALQDVGKWGFSSYENGEIAITLYEEVVGKDCFVVGSLTAPAGQALLLLRLCFALKKGRAQNVFLISPYLGYQRQDKDDGGFFWGYSLLESMGVGEVGAIDVHAQADFLTKLKNPVRNFEAFFLFEGVILDLLNQGFSFVFPDKGAHLRALGLIKKYPQVKVGYFSKRREYDLVYLDDFQGSFNKHVILYDDILDSGETLLKACVALKQMGVVSIVIFVTHSFFHGTVWNDLWDLGVSKIYCTDSLPQAHSVNHPNIEVVSISPLLNFMIKS